MINIMISMTKNCVILASDPVLVSFLYKKIRVQHNCYHGNGIIITSTGTYMVKLHLLPTR